MKTMKWITAALLLTLSAGVFAQTSVSDRAGAKVEARKTKSAESTAREADSANQPARVIPLENKTVSARPVTDPATVHESAGSKSRKVVFRKMAETHPRAAKKFYQNREEMKERGLMPREVIRTNKIDNK